MIESIVLAILTLLSQGGDPIATWVAPTPPAVAYQAEATVPVEPCELVIHYEWTEDGPFVTDRVVSGDWEGIRADVIGTYLNFTIDGSDESSVELTSDASTVEVCR